ncbi:relaxase/mobilization nuclease domain-containing protein [Gluconacetobacter sacchari]|uniref:relaxase/mobilization nuclease domain-containing protein n=1 Tax=Gluconacetobacter sacchari TaxID=92759 RepID=UPI0039B61C28
MKNDDGFRVRAGRIRSPRAQRARPFIAQALAATQRAGGMGRGRQGTGGGGRSTFGRGRIASAHANRFLTSRSRGVVIKARVVKHGPRTAPLTPHLRYLRREGVTKDGEKAKLFGPEQDEVDPKAFAERYADDRHHFRFIVSPDDAVEMADLKRFTRDLMMQAEHDLSTKLDWAAVDHWNTGHPHVHVIVRGKAQDGEELVIARDYIREGLRGRARELVTRELGVRNDIEIRRAVERQVEADRWTQLDRQLQRDADDHGIIDMRPASDQRPDAFEVLKVGRLRRLEGLGLARQIEPGRWALEEHAEATLREMGQRNDIIKRIHRGLAEQGVERPQSSWVLAGEETEHLVIGKLVGRGLDDELKGTAFAVVDGIDGRTHHVHLPSLEATTDAPTGAIVELRRFDDAKGRARVALAVRSDFTLEQQVEAHGATWLDRQAVAKEIPELGGGFGAEVRDAVRRRVDHLVREGLARREGERVRFERGLLATLRDREVKAVGEQLSQEFGKTFEPVAPGDNVAGIYRKRLVLATGRYAMIDNGLGFQLVPWTPAIELQIGKAVSGVVRDAGSVSWEFVRARNSGLAM